MQNSGRNQKAENTRKQQNFAPQCTNQVHEDRNFTADTVVAALSLHKLLKISRPRFWIYLLGPALLASTAAFPLQQLAQQPNFWLSLLYFSFPANLLLYGLNDIGDQDTDQHNPKKTAYEQRLNSQWETNLWGRILALNLPFLIYFTRVGNWPSLIYLAIFLILSHQYSLPPIRCKARPFIDSISNILYILPAVFTYTFLTGFQPTWQPILAASLWAMAMHAFSAIPDIEADKKANLQTIATKLGFRNTIRCCQALYLIAFALIIQSTPILAITLLAIYLIITQAALKGGKERVNGYYKIFPLINTISGLLIFLENYL